MWAPPSAARLFRPASWAGLLGAILLALLAAPQRAEAAASCSSAVTSADFGTIHVLAGGTTDITATLTFSCTGLVSFVPVTLCPNLAGGSGGSSGGGRLLAGPGGATLAFQAYQDSGYSQTWGSSALLVFGATPTITMTPGLSGAVSTTRTVYLRVTASATAPPGEYSSTFTNQDFFWGLNLLSCAGITIGFSIPPPSFTFKTTVATDCELTTEALAFGNVGVLDHAVYAENNLGVRCTSSTPWSLGLGNGLNGSSPTARRMARGAARVTYGIYKDTGYTQPWGDLALGAGWVNAGTGTGVLQPRKGYGRAPAQSTPVAGAYEDTVVVTLTY